MTSILYVGDGSAPLRMVITSPFSVEFKGFGTYVWSEDFLHALADAGHTVTHMQNWEAHARFPQTPEELAQYKLVILSDVERDVLLLYPERERAPMGRDRLRSICEYVRAGGALLMLGGWSSFTGRLAVGMYHGTPVEEALPVECLPITDDRVEAPEGVYLEAVLHDHPVMRGIPWNECPMFLGYNRVKLKDSATLLARVSNDPFLAVWNFGHGRAMAFASDCAPHWATAFVSWTHYPRFWAQAVAWLTCAA